MNIDPKLSKKIIRFVEQQGSQRFQNTVGFCERKYWPVESESMEEGRKSLHHQQDGHGEDSKQAKNRHQEHDSHTGVHAQTDPHHHRPQHFRQFCITTQLMISI